jgi:hypothetical protein
MSFLNFLSGLPGLGRSSATPHASFLDFARNPGGWLGNQADAFRARANDTIGALRDPFGVAAGREQAQARDLLLDRAELADLADEAGGIRPPDDRPGGYVTDWSFFKPETVTAPTWGEVDALSKPRPDSFLSAGRRHQGVADRVRQDWEEEMARENERQRRWNEDEQERQRRWNEDTAALADSDNPLARWRRRRDERRRQEDLARREREVAQLLAGLR